MLARALKRIFESRRLEGFQQIIQSVNFKSFERMLIVGGGENDDGQPFGRQRAQDLEPVYARHLDVEEKQVGPMSNDSADGFASAGALGSDGDVRFLR